MMSEFFAPAPGRWFVVAAWAPLVPVVLLCLSAIARNSARPGPGRPGLPRLYWLLGGDQPLTLGGWLVFVSLLVSFASSLNGLILYYQEAPSVQGVTPALAARWSERGDWLRFGSSRYDQPGAALQLGYHIDLLTAATMTMVSLVGSLIVLFSIGYMKDEAAEHCEDHEIHHQRRGRFGRFFLYLALFIFSMLNLLLADNLFQVFACWELVGVCSFFLIGFYYERPAACLAANKAFLMNRVGDAGLLVGLAIAWHIFGTLNIQDLARTLEGTRPAALTDDLWLVMSLGLFLGCVGKSAQLPLQTWLPDAMEGPTPVSALIHAATMVAAGVYLVGRCYLLFSPDALLIIAYTGALTLFIAATIACVQTDIKRVLAYSTVSQLGYMMLALGVGGWVAGLFHLLTHAFFKALLFLGSGSVIHGLHHEQDLRKMGGLRHAMPLTAFTMLVGVLAILGVPVLSGWYSKDQILSAALGYSLADQSHLLLLVLPVVTVGLTAYYMMRLWLLTFAGESRAGAAEADHTVHESPRIMTVPLIVLAIFSVGLGWGWPVWNAEASWLAHALHQAEPAQRGLFQLAHELSHRYHLLAGGLGLIFMLTGVGVAYSRFRAGSLLATSSSWWYRLLDRKWYFDDVYNAAVLRPTVQLARLTASFDKRPTDRPGLDVGTLDGLLNGIAQFSQWTGDQIRQIQTGLVRQYVFALLVSVAGLLVLIVMLR